MANVTIPVSVVVPVYNEADHIIDLLQSLLEQTISPKEIVLVDSGSTDDTLVHAESYWHRCDQVITLTTIKLDRSYPGRSRNAGIQQASQPWIVFIDAGITPENNWLETLWTCAENSSHQLSYGLCEFSGDRAISSAVCAMSYGYGTKIPVIPSSIFHQDVFKKVGLFREDLRSTEDIEWNNRLLKAIGQTAKPACHSAITHYRHFPNSLISVFLKWRLYETYSTYSGVNRRQQLVYALMVMVLVAISLYVPQYLYVLGLLYIVVRVGLDMLRRSQNRLWWVHQPVALLYLVPVAFMIDLGKVVGMLYGYMTMSTREKA